MAETINGSGGMPLKGREKEYATELWLDDPKAFWLHPEGPLSDTTPEEWLAKQPKLMANPYANYDPAKLLPLHLAVQRAYSLNNLLNPLAGAPVYRSSLLGGILPF